MDASRHHILRLVGLGLLATGCAEELGPVPMRVTRVHGVVREGRRPVSGGWIEFIPVDGTIGTLRSARLRADGSFDAEGVAIGRNLIRFVHAAIESPVRARIFGAYHSPIRRDIPEQPGGAITVDLVEEEIRFQQARSHRFQQARSHRMRPDTPGIREGRSGLSLTGPERQAQARPTT